MKYTQLQRFQLIDKLLYLNPEGVSSAKMLEVVNKTLIKKKHATISLRQLQVDLRELKEQLGAPIISGRGRKMIRYENAAFCLFNQTLREFRIAGTGENNLYGRLNWLRLQIQYMEDSRFDKHMMEVMDFEDNLQLANINHLPIILEAIIKRKVLRLEYATGFSEEKNIRIVHPYFLRQYNHRWYLFALYRQGDNLKEGEKPKRRKKSNRPRNPIPFAVDRIMDVSVLGSNRIRYQNITLYELQALKKEHFDCIVGVRNDPHVQPVDLELNFGFAGNTEEEKRKDDGRLFYNLLKSNPFYKGFVFSSDDACGTVRCTIKPNPELYNNLMMFAHTAHISDEGIRNEIIRRARAILAEQGADSSQDPPTGP